MGQKVINFCDNCEKEYTGYHIRVIHEYNSRCHFGKVYCSLRCMLQDAGSFKNEADKRSRSC